MKHPNRKKKPKHSTKFKYFSVICLNLLFGRSLNVKSINCCIGGNFKFKKYSNDKVIFCNHVVVNKKHTRRGN